MFFWQVLSPKWRVIKGWCLFSSQELGFSQGRGALWSGSEWMWWQSSGVRKDHQEFWAPTKIPPEPHWASWQRFLCINKQNLQIIQMLCTKVSCPQELLENLGSATKIWIYSSLSNSFTSLNCRVSRWRGAVGSFAEPCFNIFSEAGGCCSSFLGAVLSSKADPDAPTTSPWAPLPRILMALGNPGCSSCSACFGWRIEEFLWIPGIPRAAHTLGQTGAGICLENKLLGRRSINLVFPVNIEGAFTFSSAFVTDLVLSLDKILSNVL